MTARRVPCINPSCRRTASSERVGDCRYIVCQKCWKTLPSRKQAALKGDA